MCVPVVWEGVCCWDSLSCRPIPIFGNWCLFWLLLWATVCTHMIKDASSYAIANTFVISKNRLHSSVKDSLFSSFTLSLTIPPSFTPSPFPPPSLHHHSPLPHSLTISPPSPFPPPSLSHHFPLPHSLTLTITPSLTPSLFPPLSLPHSLTVSPPSLLHHFLYHLPLSSGQSSVRL